MGRIATAAAIWHSPCSVFAPPGAGGRRGLRDERSSRPAGPRTVRRRPERQCPSHLLGPALDREFHVRRGDRRRALGVPGAARRRGPHADRHGVPAVGLDRVSPEPPPRRQGPYLWLSPLPGPGRLRQRDQSGVHRRLDLHRGHRPAAEPDPRARRPDAGGGGTGPGRQCCGIRGAAWSRPQESEYPRGPAPRAERPAGFGRGDGRGAGDHVDGLDADRPAAVDSGRSAGPAAPGSW